MCYTENSAEHAVDYFNAQLGALWLSASKCFEKYQLQDRKPDTPEQRMFFLHFILQRSDSAQATLSRFTPTTSDSTVVAPRNLCKT